MANTGTSTLLVGIQGCLAFKVVWNPHLRLHAANSVSPPPTESLRLRPSDQAIGINYRKSISRQWCIPPPFIHESCYPSVKLPDSRRNRAEHGPESSVLGAVISHTSLGRFIEWQHWKTLFHPLSVLHIHHKSSAMTTRPWGHQLPPHPHAHNKWKTQGILMTSNCCFRSELWQNIMLIARGHPYFTPDYCTQLRVWGGGAQI